MKILYFAWLRAQIGMAEDTVDLPKEVTTVDQLLEFLISRGEPYSSALADRNVIRVALDQEYVKGDAALKDAKEVAFFPPVTGG
ncbi:molybdopterin converting factor subunit 1 [Sneathiella glossodoripedis]|uniref:molybdopterin converting factor subunit 1 n=1 Tax=Sneathiella glossodoripedis TaxID=418853 RepID=UPI0004707530|nr:molybdopterin converting factor subunit 1 [Sneathiella glossodoripedis]